MRFGGRYRFAASRLRIWAALNDTKILKKTIPGCTCIDWVSENALELVVSVDFGVFRQSFAGDLVLSDVVPAERYTLSGRGRGGLLGFAHGAAVVVLSDSGKGCVLAFTATGAASNAILRLGQALIGHAAQRVIDHFFLRFAEAMGVELQVLPFDIERTVPPGDDSA